MKKLVLAVIDGAKPAMLERAVKTGRAPTLARMMQEGVYVDDCVAAFPSVTPVCATSIATGVGPDEHRIPSMNWYHRGEQRYVEYGSSFQATRAFGWHRSLTDTIYNMNLGHLSRDVRTVFEVLDDADVRTACTTFLIYRGRHRHEVSRETPLARLVTSTLFRHGVYGPRELFYADIFASRATGCRGQLGMPGLRDQHSGCVGAYLLEHDLFDFLLLSLPDNDTISHRDGPSAQVGSIAAADRQLERLAHAAGGIDEFLATHAVIVAADHSHALVEESVTLADAFAGWQIARPNERSGSTAEIALCPAGRSAQVYILDPERRAKLLPRVAATAGACEGVDLVLWRDGQEGVISAGGRGELRFAPGGDLVDPGGKSWSVDGDLAVLEARRRDGVLRCDAYPNALARAWSALCCSTAGDVLLSAAAGWEFVDWGGVDHVGGGSHGSLHRSDSLGALLWCGTGPDDRQARSQWTLADVLPMISAHFLT
ncbi:MAG TPA: alkaline phosphatase family protein [Solirubrobacteraceae bacterium]|nr:alkaline phosphatase family protein [Solirubrobacteraceae bacterium]